MFKLLDKITKVGFSPMIFDLTRQNEYMRFIRPTSLDSQPNPVQTHLELCVIIGAKVSDTPMTLSQG